MTEPELKSCPFCGEEAEVVHSYEVGNFMKKWYRVMCKSIICGAARRDCFLEKEPAIIEWNKRTCKCKS